LKKVNVAIIGTKFMGKAHSNAWSQAPKFFSIGLTPVLKVACGQDEKGTSDFAKNWGWEESVNDWKKVVERPDIDIIDICTPTYLHKEIVIAAAKNGKQIFCEKPVALNFAEAREMYEAAEKSCIILITIIVGHQPLLLPNN
jgi:predicted dehydrogenase